MGVSGVFDVCTCAIFAIVEEFYVQRKTVVDGVADLLHRLLVGVPALQEAAVPAEDLLLRVQPAHGHTHKQVLSSSFPHDQVWLGHLRELFELVVDVDDRTVLQPIIADHHRLLNRTQVRVLGHNALVHCGGVSR